MTTTAVNVGPRPPTAVPAAIAAAWLLALAAQASGQAELLHHDALAEGKLPGWVSVPLTLLAWQVMLVAMMLPSSLPLISRFTVIARRQPSPGLVLAGFLAGYAVVWTAFGAVALLGDLGLHLTVEHSPWLTSHENLIGGGVLATAGLFQFSSVKKRCLTQCRLPSSFLAANYRPGVAGGFRLGRKHGVFCVGCCAALMLLMFAAGMANLLWMATLTAVMVYEKTGRAGARTVHLTGAALLAWALVVVAQPSWAPAFLTGAL